MDAKGDASRPGHCGAPNQVGPGDEGKVALESAAGSSVAAIGVASAAVAAESPKADSKRFFSGKPQWSQKAASMETCVPQAVQYRRNDEGWVAGPVRPTEGCFSRRC